MEAQESKTRVPSQGRAVRTRAALVAAAAREFAARGYAGATAKSIAVEAGAATGSFYQYFTSKDELLRELAAARQEALIERALGLVEVAVPVAAATLVDDVRARLRAVIDAVVAYHAADRGLHAVITERRLLERIAAVLTRWGHAGDTAATAFVLLATLEGTVHAHVLGRPVIDDQRLTDALVEAMLRIALPSKETSWPSSS